jgi:hypothetical protein
MRRRPDRLDAQAFGFLALRNQAELVEAAICSFSLRWMASTMSAQGWIRRTTTS